MPELHHLTPDTPALLKETNFTLWLPYAGQTRLSSDAMIDSLKTFYTMQILKAVQMAAPELAGAFMAGRADVLSGAVETLLDNRMHISHRVGLSAMDYGQHAGKVRVIVKLVCLDPNTPVMIELDVPLGIIGQDDDWDFEFATMTVLHPADTDPVEHPLFGALARFMEWDLDEVREAIEEEEIDPSGTISAQLQDFIADEKMRTRKATDEAIGASRRRITEEMRQLQEQDKRDMKRLTRHNESLQSQLDTAKASTERQRSRADALERQVREQARVNAGQAQSKASAATAATPSIDVPRAELEAAQDRERILILELTQTRGEIDALREQLHQANLRCQALLSNGDTAGESHQAIEIPTSFQDLQEWAASRLDADRILIHPKAMRAARKSTFRDVGLVCRALQALNDWYWPMKVNGDAKAGAQWEQFLDQERLRCGPTGAAIDHRLTRETYQVTYQGRRYPLDMHLQGSSSRKEEDAFRLYFNADKGPGKVLVGHFPGHLPNSHT